MCVKNMDEELAVIFGGKLMRNPKLLHKIVISMKTASCQTGFHRKHYYDKFILHMLKMLTACAFKNMV